MKRDTYGPPQGSGRSCFDSIIDHVIRKNPTHADLDNPDGTLVELEQLSIGRLPCFSFPNIHDPLKCHEKYEVDDHGSGPLHGANATMRWSVWFDHGGGTPDHSGQQRGAACTRIFSSAGGSVS